MLVHVCTLCGYEYNSKDGDPDNGIREHTDFEDLPAGWECPLCGASKEDFEAELRENDEDEEDY